MDGRRIKTEQRRRYILLNKPRGYITTRSDPQGRPTVMDLMKAVKEYIYPVGRLDYDSEGLLLLTNDGELAARLTHPRHEVEKVYEARVKGVPDDRTVERLSRGVVDRRTPDRAGEDPRVGADHQGIGEQTIVELSIHEGRQRQVRKMFDAVGHPVVRLKRVRIGRYRRPRDAARPLAGADAQGSRAPAACIRRRCARASVASQPANRIQAGRASRREVAGGQCDGGQERRREREHARVTGADLKEQGLEHAGRDPGEEQPGHGADSRQSGAEAVRTAPPPAAGSAPSATRIAISRRRCETVTATTPYNPTAASKSATAPKVISMMVRNRGAEIAARRLSSRARMSADGSDPSRARSSRRIASGTRTASGRVRTSSVMSSSGSCPTEVHHRHRRRIEPDVADVSDDADDGPRTAARSAPEETFPDGALPRPHPRRQILRDQRDA